MTRDRFFAIRSNLKIVIDGSIAEEVPRSDKFWKVRPIIKAVWQGCLQLPREKVVAADEQMIPFAATCKMNQFVRGKPDPKGLKNFVVAAPDGLVVDFELYQGKNTFPDDSVKRLGVGPFAVVRLGRTLFLESHVYCDRSFTTIPFLEYLRQQEKYCTGTIMKSRVPAAENLTSKKMIARIGRGSSEQIVRQDGEIVVVQWYDLKSVLLASSALGIQPSDACKRWSIRKTLNTVRLKDLTLLLNTTIVWVE
ncbi:piggyBac transposable element-derived protein 3-like [Anthonomus grandis grandis]|uniref:piggyBac transposable element-derived protein 3-like n=1 Tax=Anthonomus grandis grandis TaxID=2921223 RepID=UPI0021666F08|nr:piggyBac transposable element-derived protein 3-like [Anthonomus grandis grandis]